jgi:hypothetical protein
MSTKLRIDQALRAAFNSWLCAEVDGLVPAPTESRNAQFRSLRQLSLHFSRIRQTRLEARVAARPGPPEERPEISQCLHEMEDPVGLTIDVKGSYGIHYLIHNLHDIGRARSSRDDVRDEHAESSRNGVGISEEFVVEQGEAESVGVEDNGRFGGCGRRCGDVRLVTVKLGHGSLGVALGLASAEAVSANHVL